MFSCFIRSTYNSLVTCMLKVKAVCGVSMHISCACALLCDALQQFSGKTFWALVCIVFLLKRLVLEIHLTDWLSHFAFCLHFLSTHHIMNYD
ncbi:hypothetical protein BpHYR1_028387 [Brachionus plicatilis]|uniref:Uncharacterized protein n=1 Tax=Brachionus plicatilis TaxID=10195 RepID=A0A3M7RNY2_BRAPC|nr:hypothetical protein BpHYR1_028387 [Brachionus plicatilis]